MPTPVVSINKMQIGQKGTGKHWTKDEIEKRKKASEKLKRKEKVKLKMPIWLNDEARRIWKKTIKAMEGIEILDKLDEEILAMYCDAAAKYKECTLKINENGYMTINMQGTETINAYVKAAQGYMRLAMQYADKLGLNPNSRARLAKKIADEEVDPNADLFN